MTSRFSSELQIALVGLGHVAAHHIAAIDMTDGIRLAAACDIDPHSASQLHESVAFYTSIEQLLSDDSCDIVMISAPNREHYRLGRMVIDAGKALALEKPAVEYRWQFDDIVSVSKDNDVFLYIALHAAFGPEVLWFKQQLARNTLSLGEIRSFDASFYDPYLVQGELVDGSAGLGGAWMDSGINALSVLTSFINPQSLRVTESRMRAPDGLNCSETEAVVALESDNALGLIHTSWLTGLNHKTTRLTFQEDEILLDHSRQKVFRGTADSRRVIYSYDGPQHRLTNHYVGVFSDLVDRYSVNRDNSAETVLLHGVFFAADENRQWGLE
jgi:D-galactose 1-dehydrogenase